MPQLFKNLVLLVPLISNLCYAEAPSKKPLGNSPPGYAVASAHPLATNAGLEIIAQGGNAFDAAIAVASSLAVVEPYHTTIGGGGFWLLHQEKQHKNIFIDSRETAPFAASKTMFLDKQGKVIPGLSLNGGLAAAIPGQPAAFAYIAQHYGRLPLSKSLAPAIKLAEEGFVVDKQLNYFYSMGDRLEWIKKYPATATILLKEGRPYFIGETLIQKDLAKTLRLIASKGHDGFYTGEIAERLVKGVNAAGGIWTLKDLAQYKVIEREPLVGAYHNMLIITAPPPSAGGIGLITMLHVLAHFPLDTLAKLKWLHYVIESMRLAYWQRDEYLGDPAFVSIPLGNLLSEANAKRLAALIPPDKAIDSAVLQGEPIKENHKNTSHFSIMDSEGNRVSTTITVNFIFGSSVIAEGTGVLLNDEMDDFATNVGVPNVFGIVGSEPNAIAPGKRPLSNMAPTFLETPTRVAILGTPGGSRIPTMVLIASLLFHDGYGAISMASAMRFHHQYLPDLVQFEPDTFSKAIQDGLKKMGYKLMALQQYYGNMQVITWDKESQIITATADPRYIGLAAVIANKEVGYGIKF